MKSATSMPLTQQNACQRLRVNFTQGLREPTAPRVVAPWISWSIDGVKLSVARPSTGIAPISQTGEYALRAMVELALRYPGHALSAVELAQVTNVPVHYLSKVLRRLVAAGLLRSQKGHGGGFVLTRAPNRIRFTDVLRAVDEAPVSGRCAFGWKKCDASRPCPLHPAWTALTESLMRWADDTTLGTIQPREVRTPRRR
jgi:Rrf2 family iron-sulfur cluster assembly transcriptional regulator